ncbi:hypothetical protein ACFVVL_27280 [Kitasatospora sp. NPDC058115]|uniref:hypothetical protein n=1 Tax=Kitasatospora sp. NPDC058115 TaxID=3346347 RepID=UPI0036DEC94B
MSTSPTPTPTPARRRRRAAPATALAAALTLAGLGLGAVPAHATPPPGPACNPDVERIWDDITSATVKPVITEFIGFNVAPGTTGRQTQTMREQTTINTSINNNTEFNSSYKSTLSEVGVKVGFSVSTERSTTRTTERTQSFDINVPGYYGLYRGVLEVSGEWARYLCARSGPGTGYWVNSSSTGKGRYVTFGDAELGTVECTQYMPPGTVRWAAQRKICP